MISIIICTYNRDKFLYDALQHVAVNNFPTENYEIVAFDTIENLKKGKNLEDAFFDFYTEYCAQQEGGNRA